MPHTLTKADLTAFIAQLHNLPKEKAQKIVEDFFKLLIDNLVSGSSVKLSGFGGFNIHKKKERMGRNPRTGAPAKVSARRSVSFLPSVTLKKRFKILADLASHPQMIEKMNSDRAGS